jgi:hypothetical protein
MLGAAVPVLGAAAMVSAVVTHMLREIYATFSGSSVNAAVKDWNTALARTGKIAPHLSAEVRERALAAYRQGIAGEGDTLEDRIKSGAAQAAERFARRMSQVSNSAVTSALLSAMRLDKQIQGFGSRYVPSSDSGIEALFELLETNKMPVETITKEISKEIDKIALREQKQKYWFASHPQEASQYHERLRKDRRIERMRFEDQQKDWSEM